MLGDPVLSQSYMGWRAVLPFPLGVELGNTKKTRDVLSIVAGIFCIAELDRFR